ncbi:hypothetical protein PFMG_00425 [Plasmodium falciparum IGH-CR14]|uniref:Uncharacterized protein n=1 Tax=Plasmodium falciparum IGH-CR14 TaxID=580059 RepID=A0A0L1I3J6_PLAFA|nr:hypothetical protein PFMG_00425 [Plasmodium falciparum IGH-CR14]
MNFGSRTMWQNGVLLPTYPTFVVPKIPPFSIIFIGGGISIFSNFYENFWSIFWTQRKRWGNCSFTYTFITVLTQIIQYNCHQVRQRRCFYVIVRDQLYILRAFDDYDVAHMILTSQSKLWVTNYVGGVYHFLDIFHKILGPKIKIPVATIFLIVLSGFPTLWQFLFLGPEIYMCGNLWLFYWVPPEGGI